MAANFDKKTRTVNLHLRYPNTSRAGGKCSFTEHGNSCDGRKGKAVCLPGEEEIPRKFAHRPVLFD